MIRGLQKQMIRLATPKSKYFEVVLFVLRPSVPSTGNADVEMLREAHRILAESTPTKRTKPSASKRTRRALFFGGCLCGMLFSALAILLVALLL